MSFRIIFWYPWWIIIIDQDSLKWYIDSRRKSWKETWLSTATKCPSYSVSHSSLALMSIESMKCFQTWFIPVTIEAFLTTFNSNFWKQDQFHMNIWKMLSCIDLSLSKISLHREVLYSVQRCLVFSTIPAMRVLEVINVTIAVTVFQRPVKTILAHYAKENLQEPKLIESSSSVKEREKT